MDLGPAGMCLFANCSNLNTLNKMENVIVSH